MLSGECQQQQRKYHSESQGQGRGRGKERRGVFHRLHCKCDDLIQPNWIVKRQHL